jgi:very-short-patch-repair endonuclease
VEREAVRRGEVNQYGIKVIRFSNEEVIDKSDWVLEKLKEVARR